jgi:hypothetical protein
LVNVETNHVGQLENFFQVEFDVCVRIEEGTQVDPFPPWFEKVVDVLKLEEEEEGKKEKRNYGL